MDREWAAIGIRAEVYEEAAGIEVKPKPRVKPVLAGESCQVRLVV